MTTITLHPDFRIGPIDRRIFGSFVEHMGRCVYTGIYEPKHSTADEHGFRQDVADLTRELGVTVVRYPGGNFGSNYTWEDGVGPVEDRKPFLDLSCTGEARTNWADMRIGNGREKPYSAKSWRLGSEMDGPWQIGQKDAHEYGKLAAQTGHVISR